jgi:hypothetical protein
LILLNIKNQTVKDQLKVIDVHFPRLLNKACPGDPAELPCYA